MGKKYRVILKSGVPLEVESKDASRNPIGLWIWATRQYTPQVIDFKECSVSANEIAVMQEIEGVDAIC